MKSSIRAKFICSSKSKWKFKCTIKCL